MYTVIPEPEVVKQLGCCNEWDILKEIILVALRLIQERWKNKMKVIIVGGVAGGATAAARIRRLDEHAEITVFERSEMCIRDSTSSAA